MIAGPFSLAIARVVGILAIAAFSGGCSTLPKVEYACDTAKSNQASPKLAIDAAASCSGNLVGTLKSARAAQDLYSSAAKGGTFLGALVAGAAAMFSGYRDLIVGAGLFGATSYQLGNLYTPAVYDSILQAGLNASLCVDGIARKSLSAVNAVVFQYETVRTLQSVVNNDIGSAVISASVKSLAEVQSERAKSAQILADGALSTVFILSSNIVVAADSIANSVSDQIHKNAPQLDAFLRASESALAEAKKAAPANPMPAAPPT